MSDRLTVRLITGAYGLAAAAMTLAAYCLGAH